MIIILSKVYVLHHLLIQLGYTYCLANSTMMYQISKRLFYKEKSFDLIKLFTYTEHEQVEKKVSI